MKRGLSQGDLSSGEASTDCPGDPETSSGVNSNQQRAKRSRKGKATTEQLNAINDTIDHVLSQIADEANAATPTVPTSPPSSIAVQFEQLSDHLKQQQTAMNSLEQKVDFLADLLHRICDFLGLPTRPKPSCEPPPTSPTVDCPPADDVLQTEVEPEISAGFANISSQPKKQKADKKQHTADNNKTIKDIVFDAIYQESNDRAKRAKTIVISGLRDSPEIADTDSVRRLLSLEFDFEPSNFECRRLGKSAEHIQPLLVTFPSSDDAAWLIANAKQLRRSRDQWTKDNIYINRNMSHTELRASYEQRCIRRARRTRQSSQGHRSTSRENQLPHQHVHHPTPDSAADRGQPIRVVVNSRLLSDRASSNSGVGQRLTNNSNDQHASDDRHNATDFTGPAGHWVSQPGANSASAATATATTPTTSTTTTMSGRAGADIVKTGLDANAPVFAQLLAQPSTTAAAPAQA